MNKQTNIHKKYKGDLIIIGSQLCGKSTIGNLISGRHIFRCDRVPSGYWGQSVGESSNYYAHWINKNTKLPDPGALQPISLPAKRPFCKSNLVWIERGGLGNRSLFKSIHEISISAIDKKDDKVWFAQWQKYVDRAINDSLFLVVIIEWRGLMGHYEIKEMTQFIECFPAVRQIPQRIGVLNCYPDTEQSEAATLSNKSSASLEFLFGKTRVWPVWPRQHNVIPGSIPQNLPSDGAFSKLVRKEE